MDKISYATFYILLKILYSLTQSLLVLDTHLLCAWLLFALYFPRKV